METISLDKKAAVDNSIEEIDKTNTIYLQENAILRDRYKILRVIGVGGFGITYKAYDKVLASEVAIKEYYPMGLANRTPDRSDITLYTETQRVEFGYGKVRFLKEAQDLAKFNKNNGVVSVYDFFEENNTAYMVMEYLEGCTLKEYLNSTSKIIEEDMMIQVTFSVMEALDAIHNAGLIHRDISPDNIFLCNDSCVKLIDFGAVKQEMKGDAQTVSVVLKYGYAPIEQYAKKSELGPWTDIYALGATMYRMVTGENPEEATSRVVDDTMKSPKEINPGVPDYINDVIVKAMAVKYRDRYLNVEEMREALLKYENIANEGSKRNTKDIVVEKSTVSKEKEIKSVSDAKSELYERSEETNYRNGAREKNRNKKSIIIFLGVIFVIALIIVVGTLGKKDEEADKITETFLEKTTQVTTEKTTQATTEKTTEASTESATGTSEEAMIIEENVNGYKVVYDENVGKITAVSLYNNVESELVEIDSVHLFKEAGRVKVYCYFHLVTDKYYYGVYGLLHKYTGKGANRESLDDYYYDVCYEYAYVSLPENTQSGKYEFEPGIVFDGNQRAMIFITFEVN